MKIQYAMLEHFEGLKNPAGKMEARFSLLPLKGGFTISNAKLDTNCLYELVRRSSKSGSYPSSFPLPRPTNREQFRADSREWWSRVLNMPKVQRLKSSSKGWRFHNEITTDGIAVSILFSKEVSPPAQAAAKAAAEAAAKLPDPKQFQEDYDEVNALFCTCDSMQTRLYPQVLPALDGLKPIAR